MNPLLLVDSYKIHHTSMYPKGMTKLYSNFTPRKSRMKGVDNVVVFGIQHFVLEYLIKQFNEEFFNPHKIIEIDTKEPNPFMGEKNERNTIFRYERIKITKEELISEYKRQCPVDTKHIEALWDLGYLPIEIKCLEEGSLCPIGVPMLTITNTHPDFAWLVNYLETLISCTLWQPITSATIAHEYKKIFNKYALETTGNTDGVQWQGHDFSMRGMPSVEAAILSGMGHLLSFTGTDTIPAIYQLEKSYYAEGLIGASVPATEHSIECMGSKEGEKENLLRHLKQYPIGVLSKVMDTWDITKVVKPSEDGTLVQCKEEIMLRDGTLVIRPDSCPRGLTPADILCGHNKELSKRELEAYYPEFYTKGLIECLWDIFGGTTNEYGYKVLDSHIKAIYGDAITLYESVQICERLKAKGFASPLWVAGIGSMTYTGGETTEGNQYWVTRDLFGFAMKATYGEVFIDGEGIDRREIFKDPITDEGTKKSKKGLLAVYERSKTSDETGITYSKIEVKDQCSLEEEKEGLLKTVFLNSKLVRQKTLTEIRERLNSTI